MKVVIDDKLCSGHGRCYSLAPDVFDVDDEGRGMVLLADVPESLRVSSQAAVENCPEGAISISED